MGIHYYIDLSCMPREILGPDELSSLVARWDRAQVIRQGFGEKWGITDETQMRFRERIVGREGEETREATVAEVRRDCAPLEEFAHHCVNCPAALNGTPYSCHGELTLPLSAEAETWLLERLAPTGSRCLALFLDASDGQPIGPSPFNGWRQAGFLEALEPPVTARNGRNISSDQLLEELFGVGDLMPDHSLGPLLYLQLLEASDGRRGDDVLAVVEAVSSTASGELESPPAIGFALRPEEGESPAVREMKDFLLAIFIAFSLETPLALRM